MGVKKIILCTNSQLVVCQATSEFTTKDPQIAKYMDLLSSLSKLFTHFEIEQIPRIENTPIDALAYLASTWEGGQCEITVNSILHPTHDILTIRIVMSTQNDSDRRKPILDYLKDGMLSDDKSQAQKLQHMTAKFCEIKGVQYIKIF